MFFWVGWWIFNPFSAENMDYPVKEIAPFVVIMDICSVTSGYIVALWMYFEVQRCLRHSHVLRVYWVLNVALGFVRFEIAWSIVENESNFRYGLILTVCCNTLAAIIGIAGLIPSFQQYLECDPSMAKTVRKINGKRVLSNSLTNQITAEMESELAIARSHAGTLWSFLKKWPVSILLLLAILNAIGKGFMLQVRFV